MAEELLPLAEAVQSLREQIIEAADIGRDEPIRFELGPVELEFTVVAKREGGAGSKIKFSVLGIGAAVDASGKIASEHTHTVKLTLSPKVNNGGGGGKVEIRRGG
jgi:hypothetical protein